MEHREAIGFASGSYPFPLNFYNSGTSSGYLNCKLPELNKQRSFCPEVKSFSIESLLNRKCTSRASYVEEPARVAGKEELRGNFFLREGKCDAGIPQRFRPYTFFSTSNSSLEQDCGPKQRGDDRRETAGKKEWLRLKPKRMRTIFTVEQLERMESEFDRQQYMVGADRYFLATELGLTETQVKVWFQNRRIKWRKNILEKQHRKLSRKNNID